MNQTIRNLAVLLACIFMLAFTNRDDHPFTGTYAVAPADPAQIRLTINPDHTFYYQDFSVPAKKITVTGTWSQKGRKIILENKNMASRFHNTWTFTEDGRFAKSRKGLTFYTLGKKDAL